MVELFLLVIGAVISTLLALLKVMVPWPDLSWLWVALPVLLAIGIMILPLDVDCG